MADVTLSAAARSAVLSSQRTAQLAQRAQQALATGQRVTSPRDGAQAFFQARSLSSRATDLLAVKDRIGQGASAIGAAVAATDSLDRLVDQAKATALTARGGTAAERQAAAARFDELRTQIDNLAGDANFLGRNLLASTPSQLTVPFNEDRSSSLTVAGVASNSAGLGIASAVGSFNSFAADTDIDAAVTQLDGAVSTLRSTTETLGSNLAIISIREDFTDGLVNVLEGAASQLTGTDLNEEAANLLALEVRSELSQVGQNIAQQSDSLVLALF